MPDFEQNDGPDMVPRLTRWQRLGLAALFLAGVLVVGGAGFVWTGYYNISAKSEHWDATTELLELVRDQSIHARAGGIAVPDLENSDMIALGREHYRGGCAGCHGLPGEARNPVVGAMLPDPPDLEHVFQRYEASALFWLIDNGIKYTGMPSWPGENRPDEVWPLVAYLQAIDANDEPAEIVADASADGEPLESYGFHVLDACSRCHGDGETGPVSSLVPELGGQPPEYLARALREYRAGDRESGYMEPAAFGLTDTAIDTLSARYSRASPVPRTSEFDPTDVARGAEIARNGVPGSNIPACSSCHVDPGPSTDHNPNFPVLAGQSRSYLESQLEVWRQGGRDDTPYGALMATVGRELSPRQIAEVSAYYASLDASISADTP